MDRFGLDHFLPTAKRVEVVVQLCAEGYASQMVLSHDAKAAVVLATEQGFPFWAALGTILRGWALAMQGQGEAGLAARRAHGISAGRPRPLRHAGGSL
jgi:hypothetical protein